MASSTRLFISDSLEKNKQISIEDKRYNYLINVMRKKVGDDVVLVNGVDGEFLGKIIDVRKKNCLIEVSDKIRDFEKPASLCLAFGLIKRIELIAEKATELGVTEFFPIITQRTIVSNFNTERFRANVVEAVEQSERLDLPVVNNTSKLTKFIESLSDKDFLIFCEERSAKNKSAHEILMDLRNKIGKQETKNMGKIYVLVGPEGGFTNEEMELIRSFKNTYSISLGRKILRAETSTIVILGLINDVLLNKSLLNNIF